MGSLDCIPTVGKSVISGVADAFGSLEGRDVSLSIDASCRLDATDGVYFATAYASGYYGFETVSLAFSFPVDAVTPGTALSIPPSTFWGEGAHLYTSDSEVVAYAEASGVAVPLSPMVPGARFVVFFDLLLRAARADPAPMGTVCQTIAECGPFSSTACSPFASDVDRSLCLVLCTGPVEEARCADLGGVCTQRVCAMPCGAGCPAPLECGDFDGSLYCY